jgi:hypothetical protein
MTAAEGTAFAGQGRGGAGLRAPQARNSCMVLHARPQRKSLAAAPYSFGTSFRSTIRSAAIFSKSARTAASFTPAGTNTVARA